MQAAVPLRNINFGKNEENFKKAASTRTIIFYTSAKEIVRTTINFFIEIKVYSKIQYLGFNSSLTTTLSMRRRTKEEERSYKIGRK